MDSISILGYIAGVLTTSAFIPQLVKTLRTKSTEGVSLTMFLMLSFGIVLWLIYGIFIKSFPVIMANCVALFFNFIIVFLKIKYR